MADPATKPLTETYFDWIATTVDEAGFEIPHGLIVDADGGMTVIALAVPSDQGYEIMLAHWAKHRPAEMIFAFDRFTKPGQGTSLGDLMAGWHIVQNAPPRPFIIEYQHEPRIVKSIEWENPFWNAALTRELSGHLLALGLGKGGLL